jgi:predicted PurR-regulated permease PerM
LDQLTVTLVELTIRLGALLLCLYLSWVLIRPFLVIAIWSAVLTVALYPTFNWIALRLGGRRRLAAAIVTLITLAIILGPAAWLIVGLIESVRLVVSHLDPTTLSLPAPPESIRAWPIIGEPIYAFWTLASTNFQEALAKVIPQLRPLGTGLLRFAGDSGIAIAKLLISIVLAGFLLLAAPTLVRGFTRASIRLNPTRGKELFYLAGATIRAVLRGVIGIAVMQAMLAGIGLAVAGVPGATLITSIVLLSSIVQIGPGFILIPVVIWSWTTMDTTTALLFTIYMTLTGLIDNILRPIVMAHGLHIPTVVIMISVIGGTVAYGITGIFLGPIILGVIWTLLTTWIDETEAP